MSQTLTITAEQVLASAERIREDIVRDRRTLHAAPEVGTDLPNTVACVKKRLLEMGYQPRELAGGVVAEITGTETGRCLLLRADMDALRVTEQTGLDFASANGCMHACGHDMHAAMLLGAAKLLREYQGELNGTVKLVFQPDEEGFTGAKAMLSAGVLKDPAPQAGFALHVNSGTPSGLVLCGRGTFMAGCTLFRITVNGVGCHGAMPEKGVDPLNIASHIYLSLQEIISREIGAKTPAAVRRPISSRRPRCSRAPSAALTATCPHSSSPASGKSPGALHRRSAAQPSRKRSRPRRRSGMTLR